MLENSKKISAIISEHLFFKNLTKEENEILTNHAKFEHFNKGEFLLSAREESKIFYLVLSGIVSLQIFSHERGIVELETIQEGEFLGWSWLSSPYKWHFDGVATEKTTTITFEAKALKREMEHNISLGYKMYKIFTPIIIERLQAARKNLIELEEELEFFSEELVKDAKATV